MNDQIQPLKSKPKYEESNDQPVELHRGDLSYQLSSLIAMNSLFEWKVQQGKINKKIIKIGTQYISINQITKLKCLSEQKLGKWKIKITKNNQEEVYFAADTEEFAFGFPIQYFWFSKIITNKLIDMGYNLEKPSIIEQKQFDVNISNIFCKGYIYKKSQFLGNWELRYVVINNEGLFSFKNPKSSHSFFIKAYLAQYMWTRFDIVNNRLVIKIKYGIEQTQFAIPMVNYCMKNLQNWLYAFYRILRNIKLMSYWNQ